MVILLLPIMAVGQITDTWDAVYFNNSSKSKIYVNNKLVWQKQTEKTKPTVIGQNIDVFAYNDATISLSVPALSAGDLMVITIASTANTTVGAPTYSIWTQPVNYSPNNYPSLDVYYKVASGSESGGTVTLNTSNLVNAAYNGRAILTVYSAGPSPQVSVSSIYAAYSATFNVSNYTAAEDNSYIVLTAGMRPNGSSSGALSYDPGSWAIGTSGASSDTYSINAFNWNFSTTQGSPINSFGVTAYSGNYASGVIVEIHGY